MIKVRKKAKRSSVKRARSKVARKNPSRKTTSKSVTKRKRRTRAKSSTPGSVSKKRVLLTRRGGKLFAPRRGKNKSIRGMRLNPYKRRNPKVTLKNVLNRNFFMGAATYGGGILMGVLLIPITYRFLPEAVKSKINRKYLGFFPVIVGALSQMAKQKVIRDIGFAFAGVGIYDLASQNVPDTVLAFPKINENMNIGFLDSGSDEAVSASYVPGSMSASYEAGIPAAYMGASYETMGASYVPEASQTSYLSNDNPYSEAGIEDL